MPLAPVRHPLLITEPAAEVNPADPILRVVDAAACGSTRTTTIPPAAQMRLAWCLFLTGMTRPRVEL
jgi:hypothetical protein